MFSPRAFYQNFKQDLGTLLEVTDFSIPTWLAFGATFQLLSQSYLLSPNLSYWLPLLYLLYRISKTILIDCRRIFSGCFTDVVLGRWSARLPEPDSDVGRTADGVVMFLLGARINQSVFVIS